MNAIQASKTFLLTLLVIGIGGYSVTGATQLECGTAQNTTTCNPPSSMGGLCYNGGRSGLSNSTVNSANALYWTWTCSTPSTAQFTTTTVTISCQANRQLVGCGGPSNISGSGSSFNASGSATSNITNGICGQTANQSLTTTPSVGLCLSGVPTSVQGNGPWSWVCAGANGGTSTTCNANIILNSTSSMQVITRDIECRDQFGNVVADSFCNPSTQPTSTGTMMCPITPVAPLNTYSWSNGAWGTCVQTLSCQPLNNTISNIETCSALSVNNCASQPICMAQATGLGTETIDQICRDQNSNIVADNLCPLPKPIPQTRTCGTALINPTASISFETASLVSPKQDTVDDTLLYLNSFADPSNIVTSRLWEINIGNEYVNLATFTTSPYNATGLSIGNTSFRLRLNTATASFYSNEIIYSRSEEAVDQPTISMYRLEQAPYGGCSVTYVSDNGQILTETIPEQDEGLSFVIYASSIISDSCGFILQG